MYENKIEKIKCKMLLDMLLDNLKVDFDIFGIILV